MRQAKLSPTGGREIERWHGVLQLCRRSLPDWLECEAKELADAPPTAEEWAWITTNKRLVYKIVGQYRKRECKLAQGSEDIVHYLIPTIVRSLRRFDPSKGFALSTFVGMCIRNRFKPYEYDNPRLTVIPGFGRARFKPPILLGGRDLAPIEEDEPPEIGDTLDRLASAFAGLKPRSQMILTQFLGLDGQPRQTLKQIGEPLGLTRERIRQIVLKGLKDVAYWSDVRATSANPFSQRLTKRKDRKQGGMARFVD